MKTELTELIKHIYPIEAGMLGNKELSQVIENKLSGKEIKYENPKGAEYLDFKEAAELVIHAVTLIIALLKYFGVDPSKKSSPKMEQLVQKKLGKYWEELNESGKNELIKFLKEHEHQ